MHGSKRLGIVYGWRIWSNYDVSLCSKEHSPPYCCTLHPPLNKFVNDYFLGYLLFLFYISKIRLLRFEEKNVLRQEIEQLHDKVDTEESRTSKLEEKLKRSETERVLHCQRICDLSKEQEIGKVLNQFLTVWDFSTG